MWRLYFRYVTIMPAICGQPCKKWWLPPRHGRSSVAPPPDHRLMAGIFQILATLTRIRQSSGDPSTVRQRADSGPTTVRKLFKKKRRGKPNERIARIRLTVRRTQDLLHFQNREYSSNYEIVMP